MLAAKRSLQTDRYGTAPFNPKSISGLNGWWAARNFLNPGVPANGTPINSTSWRDQSSNSYALNVAFGGSAATFVTSGIGGQPAVNFPGSSGLTASTGLYNQPSTYFVVEKTTGGDATFGAVLLDGRSGARNLLDQVATAPGGNWQMYAGTVVQAGTTDSNPHVVTMQLNGAASLIRVDRTQVVSGNAGSQALQNIFVGSDLVGHGMIGLIAEVLFYNAALTTPQILQVENWLKSLYGTP